MNRDEALKSKRSADRRKKEPPVVVGVVPEIHRRVYFANNKVLLFRHFIAKLKALDFYRIRTVERGLIGNFC